MTFLTVHGERKLFFSTLQCSKLCDRKQIVIQEKNNDGLTTTKFIVAIKIGNRLNERCDFFLHFSLPLDSKFILLILLIKDCNFYRLECW